MPTRTYKRLWCKTCNEFELHETPILTGDDLQCKVCDTIYTNIKLKEIPEEKRLAQRKRYSESKRNETGALYNSFIMGSGLDVILSNENSDTIYESDAGQKQLDKWVAEEAEQLREARKVKHQEDSELKKTFKKVGRNDKCLCGSDKKYKKCCYQKIQKI